MIMDLINEVKKNLSNQNNITYYILKLRLCHSRSIDTVSIFFPSMALAHSKTLGCLAHSNQMGLYMLCPRLPGHFMRFTKSLIVLLYRL